VMCSSRRHFAQRLIAVAVAVVALLGVATTSAFADPIADAKTQAAKVQAQVSTLNTQAEVASEEYNAARERYATLSKQAAASQRALKKVTAKRDALQGQLNGRATALYRQGPLGFLGVLLATRDLSDFDVAYQMLINLSRHDALTVDDLKAAKVRAAAAHAHLVSEQAQAGVQKQAMASNAASVRAHLAKSKQVLTQANSTVKRLIAEQKAREAAAARAAAAAALAAQRAYNRRAYASSGGSVNYGNPPVSGTGAKAVWYAEKKLGCPYVWAASGPNTFDCSGLVMWAYAQVGISLPHYSREQINCGKPVGKSNLEPGDLVFFGSPIHHVGMYVGGGRFIEAPYSGASVRISNLSNRSDYAGACRP
jgi:peptidoglycan DL-endopeptidase CwlO